MDLSAEKVALKHKELWQVERVFRDVETMLHTRPVSHQKDENIRGHVFCSFPALVLRKELECRLNAAKHVFEWSDIKQDLKALQQVTIEGNGKEAKVAGRRLELFETLRSALFFLCSEFISGFQHDDTNTAYQ